MALDLKGISILFFCPKFFGYEIEIQNNLENMGATVLRFDDRPSNNFVSKVLIRLDKRLLRRKINKYYKTIISQLAKNKIHLDYVLFISPESISPNLLTMYKAQFQDAKFILYMWDSVKNKKNCSDLFPLFDSKFTFDTIDAKTYNLILRPLFYINLYQEQNKKEIFDLLFIGTAHSDRYKLIQKIKSAIKLNYKTYFYMNSKLLFFTKKIFEKNFWNVPYNEISFKSLSHVENANFLHQSRAIIDINHPKQVGLTMRTIETLGAQKKLVTTNANIVNYDFYNKNNVFIIDRENPEIDLAFLEGTVVSSTPEILFKYSIEGWIYTIFNLS